MRRYIRLQTLTNVFRVLELCLALALVSWVSARVPFAVRISGEFFRRIAGVIGSPLFVFMLSNAIIVTLVAKSGRFRGEDPGANNAETGIYEELIENSEHRCPNSLSENPNPLPPEGTVYQDKKIISQLNVATDTCPEADDDDEMGLSSGSDSDTDSDMVNPSPRAFRRTRSEKLRRKFCTEKAKLLRSETNKCGKTAAPAGQKQPYPEDELSDEEFQRAVDKFIAKHLKFRRQESLAIVPQKHAFGNERAKK